MSTTLPYRKSKLSTAILMASIATLSSTNAYATPSDVCSEVTGDVQITDDQSSSDCTLTAGQSVMVTSTGSVNTIKAENITANSITNDGTIQASFTGVNVINSTMQGSIVNDINGEIDAGRGASVFNSTINGDFINNGNITAENTGFETDSRVTGKILNAGTMTSANDAISVFFSEVGSDNEGDGVFNSGTIESSDKGISILDADINGNVENSGDLVNADTNNNYAGIEVVFDSTVSGSVINSGDITNYSKGIKIAGSSVTGDVHNTSTGIISIDRNINLNGAPNDPKKYGGLIVEGTTIGGNVINGGEITANDKGIGVFNSTISPPFIDGISIVNSTINGDVINTTDGSISTKDGIVIRDNTTISGSIINNGIIDTSGDGIKIDGDEVIISVTGDLTNSGSIDSENEEGINLDNLTIGGNFTNTANASINALDDDAVEFDDVILTGNFVNSGSIDGENGVDIDDSSIVGSFTNTATGTINGDEFGFEARSFTLTGSFTNDGSITATSENSYGVYIDSDSILSTFTNTGTITGTIAVQLGSTNNSINISNVTNTAANITTFNNSGTLNGNVELANHVMNISGGVINGDVIGGEDSIVNFTGDFTTGGNFWADSTNINEGVTLTLAHELNEAFQPGTVTNNGTIYVRDGETGTINDSYIQSATGQFKLDLSSATSYGQLVINGDAEFVNTAKIDVNVIGAPKLVNNSTIEDVVTADTITFTTESITANTATLKESIGEEATFEVSDNSAVFDFEGTLVKGELVTDGDSIDLIVKQVLKIKEIASTPAANNGGVADVIDGFIGNGTDDPGLQSFVTAIGQIEDVKDVAKAVDQVLPLLTGNQQTAQLGAVGEIGRIVQARAEGQLGMSSSADAEKNIAEDQYVWVQAFGSMADQDDYQSVTGFDADTKGMAFGIDTLVSSKDRVGLSFAYSQTDVDSNDNLNQAEVDTYSLIAYGSHSMDEHTQFSYQAGYGIHKSEGKRYIPLMGTVASSDTESQSINAAASLLRNTPLNDRTTFTPSFFSQYTWIDNDSYTETGAGSLNLNVDGNDSQQWLFGLSGKITQVLNDTVSLDMSAGLAYDLLNDKSQVTSTFAGDPTAAFSTTGLERNPVEYRAGIGLNVSTDSSLKLKLSYDYAGRTDFSNQSILAKLRWSF